MDPLTDNAKKLIFEYEGLDQPGDWPGGESGITIGIGYDLGYESRPDFDQDWKPLLDPASYAALAAVTGLKGSAAQAKAPTVKSIRIKQSDAETVFLERTVPKYQKTTESAFPGVGKLPADAQGALLSLVYNRGAGMQGDSRTEMRAIRDAIAKVDSAGVDATLQTVADQIRAMKRLWEGKGLDGLLARRDAEADLVESCRS